MRPRSPAGKVLLHFRFVLTSHSLETEGAESQYLTPAKRQHRMQTTLGTERENHVSFREN